MCNIKSNQWLKLLGDFIIFTYFKAVYGVELDGFGGGDGKLCY